jgi:hypothetical protein
LAIDLNLSFYTSAQSWFLCSVLAEFTLVFVVHYNIIFAVNGYSKNFGAGRTVVNVVDIRQPCCKEDREVVNCNDISHTWT